MGRFAKPSTLDAQVLQQQLMQQQCYLNSLQAQNLDLRQQLHIHTSPCATPHSSPPPSPMCGMWSPQQSPQMSPMPQLPLGQRRVAFRLDSARSTPRSTSTPGQQPGAAPTFAQWQPLN